MHLAKERKREYNRLRQRRKRGTPAPAAKDEKTPAAKEAGVQKKKNDDMLWKRVERGNLHPAPRRAWGSVSGVEVDKASHLIYMSEDAQAARHRWAVESHAGHLRHVGESYWPFTARMREEWAVLSGICQKWKEKY